ncbi:MAG: type IV pilin [Haloarculaceae archaeon]
MSRAVSSVVGTLLLAAIAVLAATTVGVVATVEPPPVTPTARLSASADAGTDRIALTHETGDTLAVSDLSLTVAVDGEELDRQPPVPFFAARGFESGPTGPFNVATADRTWSAGETAAVRLASTNDPTLSPGSRIEVTVATEAGVITSVETVAK